MDSFEEKKVKRFLKILTPLTIDEFFDEQTKRQQAAEKKIKLNFHECQTGLDPNKSQNKWTKMAYLQGHT